MERSHSGRVRHLGKVVGCKRSRGFESLPLRKLKLHTFRCVILIHEIEEIRTRKWSGNDSFPWRKYWNRGVSKRSLKGEQWNFPPSPHFNKTPTTDARSTREVIRTNNLRFAFPPAFGGIVETPTSLIFFAPSARNFFRSSFLSASRTTKTAID